MPEKVPQSENGENTKPQDISRRKFLRNASLITAGVLTGTYALSKGLDKLYFRFENEIASSVEEFIQKSNEHLLVMTNAVEETYPRHLTEIEKELSYIETTLDGALENFTERDLNAYGELLEKLELGRQTQKSDLENLQETFSKFTYNIDTLLENKGNIDKHKLLSDWGRSIYLPKEIEIEKQIQSLGEWYTKIDDKFNVLIKKVEAEIQRIERELKKKDVIFRDTKSA